MEKRINSLKNEVNWNDNYIDYPIKPNGLYKEFNSLNGVGYDIEMITYACGEDKYNGRGGVDHSTLAFGSILHGDFQGNFYDNIKSRI